MAEFRFEQCADGLMDCSVWRWQDEFTETRNGNTVTCLQQLVWKPVRFGPMTRERAELFDKMIARVIALRSEKRQSDA